MLERALFASERNFGRRGRAMNSDQIYVCGARVPSSSIRSLARKRSVGPVSSGRAFFAPQEGRYALSTSLVSSSFGPDCEIVIVGGPSYEIAVLAIETSNATWMAFDQTTE